MKRIKIMKENIEKVLKGNGWMSEDIIAEKLNASLPDVDRILRNLERLGLVESRFSK